MFSHALLLASLSEGIVNATSEFVKEGGLPAIFALMAISAACIPIPSEVVMLFAGFVIADPHRSGSSAHLTMTGVLLAGLAGSLVGSWVAYGVGWAGRVELLERHGQRFHMGPKQISRAEAWFERFGPATVLFGRLVPLVRAFVSLPAGLARMGFVRFTLLTALGSAIWVAALAYTGEALGSEWRSVRHGFEYVDYALLAAIVFAAGYLVLRRRRARREDAASAPAVDVAE